ncbi:hypothetical protein RYX36_029381 [Vicia faba]
MKNKQPSDVKRNEEQWRRRSQVVGNEGSPAVWEEVRSFQGGGDGFPAESKEFRRVLVATPMRFFSLSMLTTSFPSFHGIDGLLRARLQRVWIEDLRKEANVAKLEGMEELLEHGVEA